MPEAGLRTEVKDLEPHRPVKLETIKSKGEKKMEQF
jgi:hypothetical protein